MSASSIKTPPILPTSMPSPWIASRFMAWKEFKQNAPLVLVFAGFMALILTIFAYDRYFNTPQRANQDAGAFYLIYVLTNLFALTMGVFLFSPEKENKTAQLLQQLPITSGFAVRSKLLYGLISILCFVLIGAVFQGLELLFFNTTINFNIEKTQRFNYFLIAIGAILFPFECYFWGALCSLAIKRTLYAVIAATGCVVLVSWVVPAIVLSCLEYSPGNSDFHKMTILLIAKACLLAVGALAFRQAGANWLGNSPQQRQRTQANSSNVDFSHPALANPPAANTATVSSMPPVASSSQVYRVLIWQSFAQFKKEFLLAMTIGPPLAIFGWVLMFDTFDGQSPRSRVRQSIMLAIIGLSLITWIGSLLTFSNDHREKRYHFFQQHVEHGRRLWFARMLPVVALAAISLLGISGTLIAAGVFTTEHPLPPVAIIGLASGFAIFTIASIGQYNSMLFRSGVFSFSFMVLMTLGIGGWTTFACILGGNLFLFVLPIPFALFAITWWHSPAWLACKPGLLNTMVPHLAAAAVACTLIGGFFWARYTEHPPTQFSLAQLQSQYSLLDTQRPPELEGSRLIRDAAANMVRHDGEPMVHFDHHAGLLMAPEDILELANHGYLEKNTEILNLIKSALSLDNDSAILDPRSQKNRAQQITRLRHLLAVAAQLAELNGKLDVALDYWLQLVKLDEIFPIPEHRSHSAIECLLRWAEIPEQTPELMARAIAGISFTSTTWHRHASQSLYLGQLDFENLYQDALKDPADSAIIFGTPGFLARLPSVLRQFEMERSRRIAHQFIPSTDNSFAISQKLATDSRTSLPSHFGNKDILQNVRNIEFSQRAATFSSRRPFGGVEYLYSFGLWNQNLQLQEIQNRRYAQVRLGLIAWRLEKGNYPENISNLSPKYLDNVPLDLYYGGNFIYEPQGLDHPIEFGFQENSIASGTPFLLPWSTIEHFAAPPSVLESERKASYSDVSNYAVRFHDEYSFELPKPKSEKSKPSESDPEQ